MTTVRVCPRRIATRKAAAWALAGVLSATAVAPHSRADSAFEWLRPDSPPAGSEVHDVVCSHPDSAIPHWHADRVIREAPCLACQRSHNLAASFLALAAGASLPKKQPVSETTGSAHTPSLSSPCSRAPPALL
jgi:hypothetical protein